MGPKGSNVHTVGGRTISGRLRAGVTGLPLACQVPHLRVRSPTCSRAGNLQRGCHHAEKLECQAGASVRAHQRQRAQEGPLDEARQGDRGRDGQQATQPERRDPVVQEQERVLAQAWRLAAPGDEPGQCARSQPHGRPFELRRQSIAQSNSELALPVLDNLAFAVFENLAFAVLENDIASLVDADEHGRGGFCSRDRPAAFASVHSPRHG